MLGIIIFLLSICAVGFIGSREEGAARLMFWVLLNILIAVVLAVGHLGFGLS